jgi:predicted DsbA family dithiol-disulfide isomerase
MEKLPTRCSFIASEDDNMLSIWPKRKDETWAQEMMDSMTQNAKKFRIRLGFEKKYHYSRSFNAHRLCIWQRNTTSQMKGYCLKPT